MSDRNSSLFWLSWDAFQAGHQVVSLLPVLTDIRFGKDGRVRVQSRLYTIPADLCVKDQSRQRRFLAVFTMVETEYKLDLHSVLLPSSIELEPLYVCYRKLLTSLVISIVRHYARQYQRIPLVSLGSFIYD